MPCSDGRGSIAAWDLARKEGELRRRNDSLSRIACELARWVEGYGPVINNIPPEFSKETRDWWAAHKRVDAAREAEEAKRLRIRQVKEAAIKKLTPEERKVLGV